MNKLQMDFYFMRGYNKDNKIFFKQEHKKIYKKLLKYDENDMSLFIINENENNIWRFMGLSSRNDE